MEISGPTGSVQRRLKRSIVNELVEGAIFNGLLLVRKINFHEMCARYDEHELEYDVDDLWEAYKTRGVPWDVLKNGEMKVWWPDETG
mgnify:CR=1 FL=1